jgi:hypothetical protein
MLTEPNWSLLDFPVALEKVYTAVRPGSIQGALGVEIPKKRAVVRADTGQVLSLVSSRYPLIPHRRIFAPMQEAIGSMGMRIGRVETRIGLSGAVARVTWLLDRTVEVGEGDVVTLALSAQNSYNRTSEIIVELGGRRQSTGAALTAPTTAFRRSFRHRAGVQLSEVRRAFDGLLEQGTELAEQWKQWAGRTCSAEALSGGLSRDRFGAGARQAVISRFREGRAATVWEAYNALAYYATHTVRSRRPELLLLRQDGVHKLAVDFARRATAD